MINYEHKMINRASPKDEPCAGNPVGVELVGRHRLEKLLLVLRHETFEFYVKRKEKRRRKRNRCQRHGRASGTSASLRTRSTFWDENDNNDEIDNNNNDHNKAKRMTKITKLT